MNILVTGANGFVGSHLVRHLLALGHRVAALCLPGTSLAPLAGLDVALHIGDVTDRVALTPVAIREGHAFADTVFGRRPWAVDYEAIPTAVFTNPPVGTIGLAEEEARGRGSVDIYRSRFRPLRHTLSNRRERSMMKLVVGKDGGRVLGVHMVGEDAPEIIQSLAVAVKMGATKADFDAAMALHPTSRGLRAGGG